MGYNYLFDNSCSKLFTDNHTYQPFLATAKRKQNTNLLLGFNLNWFLTLIVVLFASQFNNKMYAQVTITKPNLSITTCSYPSSYNSLGNITIKEANGSGGKNDFSSGTNLTLILTAPANFEFNPGVGTTTISAGTDLSVISTVVTSTTITITYTCSAILDNDTIVISGISIRAINNASTGIIIRTGGTAIVDGLTITPITTLTNTLTSTTSSPPSITIQPATPAAVCPSSGIRTISITATSATTYQWRKNGVNLTNVAPYSNVTTATLTITNPNFSENGAVFDVIVGNAIPCTVTSSSVILTITATPIISTQPVATAVCTTGSTTFNVVASGVTTYQWRRNGVNLTNVAPYSNVTTPTLTITNPAVGDAGNFDVVLNSATCPLTSNAVALTVNTVPSASITPSPTNAATGVCYGGSGAITSISWAATAGATSYDVYFGTAISPVTLSGNVTTNSYTTGALAASTTYYWRIVAKNACGDAATSATWSFTTAAAICTVSYCTPTGNLNCTTNGDYIANVTFNTLNNSTTCNASGYTVFAATGTQTTTVIRGNTFNFSLETGPGNKKHGAAVWIDFNQNGNLADAGEYFLIGGNGVIANSINTIAIPIPAGATLGATRMRVRYGQKETMASTLSCTMSGTYGETEDYTITISDPIACVTPTTQPTVLILNPTGTTIAGSFTAPSPAPNNYLVYISTTNTAPTPVNGTTYVIGAVFGAGTIVDADSNATFTATGLTPLTTYYVFVFAYNSACSGGPTYNVTSPLNGTATTIAANYCIPSVTSPKEDDNYITEVSFIGTLNDVSNYSTYSSSPLGYQDFTGLTNLSRQAQGEGVNISIQALFTSYTKAWVDWNKDGLFDVVTELVYNSATISTGSTTFGFIIPSAQALGNYRIRIRVDLNGGSGSTTFTSCLNLNNGGETEDYLFTVVASCNSLIDTVTDARTCGPGTVDLVASSSSAGVTEYRWYSTPTGATLVGTSPIGSWTTPSINITTTYYVTAYNGCESLVRTAINAIVSPVPSLTYSPTNPTVCGEDVVIALNATGDVEEVFLIDEKFTSGLGTFTNTNITSSVRNTDTQWQNRISTYIPTAIAGVNTWYPAISTGVNGNGFAMATSDFSNAIPYVHNQMASTTLNSTDFVNLTLSLRMFFSRYYIDDTNLTLEYVTIDVSTNGGTGWTEIKRFTEDVGIGTRFETLTYDLSAYINQSNLKIRVRYYTNQWCDGLAVDDIKLYGNRPIGTALSWTSATPVAAFTDAACTIPYVANTPAIDVYVKPTLTQLEEGSFTFTANATLDNGCATSQVITVTNRSKIWQGLNGDWNDANNWKPNGIPTADNCVIIKPQAFPSTISSGADGLGKNLTVKNGGNLNIAADKTVTITNYVNVEAGGIFQIENNGSLVQVDNVANTGSITYKRTADNINGYDYVYWSSPVSNQSLGSIYTSPTQGPKYQWNTTVNNGNGASGNTGQGNWEVAAATMVTGKGYIVRGSSNFGMAPTNINSTFTGVPNNGDISITVYRGIYTGADYAGANGSTITNLSDNYNLLGNPYPSAINGLQFLSDNSGVIEGSVDLWKHVTAPTTGVTNPFYGSFTYNYASSYETINFTGSTIPPPPGIPWTIKAGQAFFVKMKDGAAASGTVNFNNGMRNGIYSNSGFFKTSNNNDAPLNFENIERHRIWLDIVASNNTSERALIGYVSGATLEEDHFYDAITIPSGSIDIYSLIGNQTYNIQGRALPFSDNDLVPIGYKAGTSGSYHIAINALDGLFETQNIYLEDLSLQVIHDLKLSPYLFTTESGIFNNRFVLRYTNSTLSNLDFESSNAVQVVVNEKVAVYSGIENIKEIEVFDVLGRKIDLYKNVNEKQFQLNKLKKTMSTLILKIKLGNEVIVTEKIIY